MNGIDYYLRHRPSASVGDMVDIYSPFYNPETGRLEYPPEYKPKTDWTWIIIFGMVILVLFYGE
jgi:hypothetical protein